MVDQQVEIRFSRYRDKLRGLRKFKKHLVDTMEVVKKIEFGAIADCYAAFSKLAEKENKIKTKL